MAEIRVREEWKIEEYFLTLLPGYSMLFPILVLVGMIPLESFDMVRNVHDL